MPASTTLFKTKWNTFVTKLTPIHSSNDAQQPRNQLRRDSDDTIISRIKNRKHSDAMSVGTFESTVSMKDKFRQAIPFFRRRSSSNISTCNDEVVSHSTTSAPSVDYCHELEKLQALYTLAIDEVCIHALFIMRECHDSSWFHSIVKLRWRFARIILLLWW